MWALSMAVTNVSKSNGIKEPPLTVRFDNILLPAGMTNQTIGGARIIIVPKMPISLSISNSKLWAYRSLTREYSST